MSSDNGIYIASFPNAEWRVSYAGAIDNVEYGSTDMQDAYRASIFGNAPKFSSLEAAEIYAEQLENDVGYTEYGVCAIDAFDRPLVVMTEDEINKQLGYGKYHSQPLSIGEVINRELKT